MPTDSEDRDLRDVMQEEQSRGSRRRRVDTAEKKKQQRLQDDVLRTLKSGDRHAYVRALREAQIVDGTPGYVRALKAFESYHGRR
jgi:hypothetical protein